VADEPVSMLDVSIRASILNLLQKIAERRKAWACSIFPMTFPRSAIFVPEPPSCIWQDCRNRADGRPDSQPVSPYVRALLASVPVPDPDYHRKRVKLSGEVLTPLDLRKDADLLPMFPSIAHLPRDGAGPQRPGKRPPSRLPPVIIKPHFHGAFLYSINPSLSFPPLSPWETVSQFAFRPSTAQGERLTG